VLRENGLPEIAPLAKTERVMLERKRLDDFYRELQTPSRIQANTQTPQVEAAGRRYQGSPPDVTAFRLGVG
jgi:hypothetical protein